MKTNLTGGKSIISFKTMKSLLEPLTSNLIYRRTTPLDQTITIHRRTALFRTTLDSAAILCFQKTDYTQRNFRKSNNCNIKGFQATK